MTVNEFAVLAAVAVFALAIWLDSQIPRPRPPYGGAA